MGFVFQRPILLSNSSGNLLFKRAQLWKIAILLGAIGCMGIHGTCVLAALTWPNALGTCSMFWSHPSRTSIYTHLFRNIKTPIASILSYASMRLSIPNGHLFDWCLAQLPQSKRSISTNHLQSNLDHRLPGTQILHSYNHLDQDHDLAPQTKPGPHHQNSRETQVGHVRHFFLKKKITPRYWTKLW